MKKLEILVIAILLIAITGCNTSPKQPEGGYLVTGELIGFDEPMLYKTELGEVVDSVAVINGKFTMTGKLEKPEEIYLKGKVRFEKFFGFYLDNAAIQVKVDFTKDKNEEPDAFLAVIGSPANDIKREIKKSFEEADSKYKGASRMSLIKYKTGQFYYLLNYKPEYIGWVSLEMAKQYFKYNLYTSHFPVENAEKLASIFKENYSDTEQYKIMIAKIEAGKKRVEGEKFIDFTSKDEDGNEITLSDYYGKSYVLVDLWASWCGPCRAENPYYKKAVKRFKDKGFKIFSISFDDNKKRWVNAIKEDKIYEFVHVSDLKAYDNPVAKTYKINAIPDNFLLDSEGNIVDNALRGEELLETLEHLYSK